MEVLITIAFVLGMYVFVYYLVTWVNRIKSSASVQCPEDGNEYDVELLHRTSNLWEKGRAVDVVRCTAFQHPDQVTCDRKCLKLR